MKAAVWSSAVRSVPVRKIECRGPDQEAFKGHDLQALMRRRPILRRFKGGPELPLGGKEILERKS
jgi:hypothetical protein